MKLLSLITSAEPVSDFQNKAGKRAEVSFTTSKDIISSQKQGHAFV